MHTFRVVRPQATLERGGGNSDNQPNSCNLCHWHAKDKPADLQKALDDGLRGVGPAVRRHALSGGNQMTADRPSGVALGARWCWPRSWPSCCWS